ncbi:tetratricopeptide repeat protein [Enterococcus sp. LJL128]
MSEESINEYLEQARKFEEEKEYDKAIEVYDKLIELDLNNPEYRYVRSTLYNKMNLFQEAIDDVLIAIKFDSKQSKYFHDLGNYLHEIEDYEQAITMFKQAIKLNNTEADYFNDLGISYDALGNYNEAKKQYLQALELDSENPIYLYNLGDCLNSLGNYEQAIKMFEQAIELKNTDADYFNSLGISYDALGNHNEAKKQYLQALELDSEKSVYLYNLGDCLNSLRNYEQAIKMFKQAIELKNTDADYFNSLGISYDALGNHNEAKKQYLQALELDSENPTYLYNLGDCWFEIGDYKQAIDLYKQAIQLKSTEASYFNSLATSYSMENNTTEAIKNYKQAIQLNSNEPVFFSNLGISYLYIKKYEEALKNFLNVDIDTKKMVEFVCICLIEILNKNSSLEPYKELLMKPPFKFIFENLDFADDKLILAILELYKSIQIFLRDAVEDCNGKEIAHYTSLGTLRNILENKPLKEEKQKEKTEEDSENQSKKIRLYNTEYMNDPEEGLYLFSLLNGGETETVISELETMYANSDELTCSNTFITCFTEEIDRLPMWSMYGNDGEGVCLILEKSVFLDKKAAESFVEIKENAIDDFEKKSRILYKTYYLDKDLSNEETVSSTIEAWKEILTSINLQTADLSSEHKQNVLNVLFALFDEVRFLFKSDFYSYEKEYRLLVSHDLNGDRVKVDMNGEIPKLYLEIENVNYSKVVLGSKVEHPNMWMPFIKRTSNIKSVKKSSIRYQ